MIKINQKWIDVSQIDKSILSSKESNILQLMGKASKVYEYETMAQLEFELAARLQIIQSAMLLDKSGATFATFQTSKCNEQFWKLTEKGAFVLKPNILPQTAIEDIFRQGHKYAFECAVAIVIIYYKAVLESINKQHFNQLFADLYLYSWKYDQDLDLRIHEGTDFLPGDCVYFKNPDHDPKTPEWQGENAILLDKDLYFGHGIGITSAQGIINALNTKRKKNSNKSAFLIDHITRPNFRYLSQFRSDTSREKNIRYQHSSPFSNLIISEVGSKAYFL